jgi:hypothetical protein
LHTHYYPSKSFGLVKGEGQFDVGARRAGAIDRFLSFRPSLDPSPGSSMGAE